MLQVPVQVQLVRGVTWDGASRTAGEILTVRRVDAYSLIGSGKAVLYEPPPPGPEPAREPEPEAPIRVLAREPVRRLRR
jgi:hypothetical protein